MQRVVHNKFITCHLKISQLIHHCLQFETRMYLYLQNSKQSTKKKKITNLVVKFYKLFTDFKNQILIFKFLNFNTTNHVHIVHYASST